MLNTIKNDRILAFNLLLVFSLILIKFFYLSKIYIIEDEAYYWFWANHLSWGYPEHPPMVAWSIAPLRSLFGASPFAIRLPSMIMFLLLIPIVYFWGKELAKSIFNRTEIETEKLAIQTGLLSVVIVQTIPFYAGASIINLPDSPLIFFLFLTASLYYTAFFINPKYFLFAGMSLGFAMLSKLTAAHMALTIAAFIIISPKRKSYLKSPSVWLSFIMAGAIFSPFLLWNAKNGFPILTNLNLHLNRTTNLNKFLQFWIEQAILYLPIFLIVTVSIIIFVSLNMMKPKESRERRESRGKFNFFSKKMANQNDEKLLYVILLSLMPFSYFLYKSITLPLRINWLSGVFVGLTFLSALILAKYWKFAKYWLTIYTLIITLLFWMLLSFLANSTATKKNFFIQSLQEIYPNYNFYLKSYYEYFFFDQRFKSIYQNQKEKYLSNLPDFTEIPIVARGYQTPSLINYYVQPSVEAFGWAHREDYVQMIYFFSEQTPHYQKILSNRYFLLSRNQNPNLAEFGFNPSNQTIRLLTSFSTYPQKPEVSKDYYWFFIERIK